MARIRWQGVLAALTVFTVLFPQAASQTTENNSNNNNNNTSSLNSTHGALFISPARDLAFALSIPDDPKASDDIYFSMAMSYHTIWAAVGMGSSTMSGSLMLVMYGSASGQNVTMSPRIARHGHSEPTYAPEIKVEMLPGSGLVGNGTMFVYNGVCRDCLSWSPDGGGGGGDDENHSPQGRSVILDVASTRQPMIFATGAAGLAGSDDPACPLRVHYNYGAFTMDMTRAKGGPAGSPPVINTDDVSPESIGATLVPGKYVTKYREIKGVLHAVIMVLCFVGLFPFGSFVLRLGGWVRWHAVTQGCAFVLVIVGAGLGFGISGLYNRSRNYNTAHQVIGLLVFIFLFGQFALGFLHHRKFKQTRQTTKFAPVHVWLGRLLIILGVINGFLGFNLSQAFFYNYVLGGLLLFIFSFFLLVLLVKKFIWKRIYHNKSGDNNNNKDGSDAGGGGYDLEPWRHVSQQQHQYAIPPGGFAAPPTYHASASASRGGGGGRRTDGMGPQQSAREYV